VAVTGEPDADRHEHHALGEPVAGRIEEGAERRDLRGEARHRAVEHVADAGQQQHDRGQMKCPVRMSGTVRR